MDNKQRNKLEYQLIQLFNNGLNQEEMIRLREWLKQDTEALDHYLRFVTVRAGLSQTCIQTANIPIPDLPSEEDETTPTSIAPSPKPTQRIHRLWAIVVVAASLIIGALLVIRQPLHHPDPPSGNPSATLIGVHQATWPSWTHTGFVQNSLRAGHWQLTQGFAKIRLLEGTEIILHAPCNFILNETNHLDLISGRIYVYVPQGAEGFSITTAGAHLVDYGTEFGVIANHNGNTEVHVFTGSVGIRPAESPDNFEHRLTQGQAAAMDQEGIMSPTTCAYPKHFVNDLAQIRHSTIPGKQLDLADMIGGGNGYGTGRLDTGIDPGTGQILNNPLSQLRMDNSRRYHRQPNNPYVDGVFVPNANKGLNIISSTHLSFKDCPKTNGAYYDGIFNGAKMSLSRTRVFHLGKLKGQPYGTSIHPAINMHTNAGITFDLNAIRTHNPGSHIERFKALCGISDTVARTPCGSMDFWILVDGEVRFHYTVTKKTLQNTQQADIELKDDERFLTLATTSHKGIDYKWTFFAEPTLELVPIKNH